MAHVGAERKRQRAYVNYRLSGYRLHYALTDRLGFSVPNGSGEAAVAAAAYGRWAAAILNNLFPAQSS